MRSPAIAITSTRSPRSSTAGSSPAPMPVDRTGRARSRRQYGSSTGRSPGSWSARSSMPSSRRAGSARSTSTRISSATGSRRIRRPTTICWARPPAFSSPGSPGPSCRRCASGALLFRRGDFKLKAGRLDDKARWLLGRDAQAQYDALDTETTRLPLRQTFPEGGYYILGAEFDSAAEVRAVVDAGPLGYTSIAAHGHADALSFTLSVGGREFLIDPGTYAYHTQKRWRQYFRGTSAHNTLRIDGRDQSEQGGNFLWLKKARAGCGLWLSSAEKDSFEGWHDGYMQLEDPVKHRRLIELDKGTRRLLIEDTLEMAE